MAKDVDGDGQLRFGEFLCAMHLAERHNTVTDLGSLPGRWAPRTGPRKWLGITPIYKLLILGHEGVPGSHNSIFRARK